MPKHILLATNGPSGMLYSSIELARRLAAAGHRVTFAAPAAACELAQHHGLAITALEDSGYDRFLVEDAGIGPIRRLSTLGRRRQRAADSMGLSEWTRAVRELDPDLLLIDGEMHEHIITASASGVPLALLNTFASIWHRPGLPPPHHMVRPGVGWWGTGFGISMLWRLLHLRKRSRVVTQWARRIGCDRVSILRWLALEAGFDLRAESDQTQWLIPFTYRNFPVLSLHALEFEFPHLPPDHVHYVGPMVLESRLDPMLTPSARAELETIFSRCRTRGHKLIYAGFGSVFSTEPALLRSIVAAVGSHREWEMIISLGNRGQRADLGELPSGVHTFDWVPQLEVLQNSDACVTHGGINTIDECVLGLVPMLVYCGGETDMAGNAARVAHWKLGLVGDRRHDTTATMRLHLEQLLEEHRFHDNLSRLRDRCGAYTEDHVAEQIVESLLVSGGPNRSSLRDRPPRRADE
ncbi:MAG: glycosyltransferase [Thermoanaerobaculia bacterium]